MEFKVRLVMLYKIRDVDDKVHFIFIVAENVKVSINGTTRFVNYTDNDGMNGYLSKHSR